MRRSHPQPGHRTAFLSCPFVRAASLGRTWQLIVIGLMLLALSVSGSPRIARGQETATPESDPAVPPPALRVVKLLWKTQPKSAASALEKLIEQSITRHRLSSLGEHLRPLDKQLKEVLDDPQDVR